MSRLSIRPRPLDIHKKLPIVKCLKDFEDDDAPVAAPVAGTRSSQLHRLSAVEAETEVHQAPTKKGSEEIPTPQYTVVDTYERDYLCTFFQPTSYVRARGARAEIGEFVEYDLDNEDENWLDEFNNERKGLSPEKFEILLFKLETLDHKARERAGVVAPAFGSLVPVLLDLDSAFEALQSSSVRFVVFQSVYSYWKAKRERWQKPIMRRLQPPPPVNDTNPYNVFRPREKAHRHHTRRMQRRENNVQSFEKLRQVRRNLDQAKAVFEALIKREEKKRDVIETEVNLQRIQLKYKHEAELVDDAMAVPGLQLTPSRFESSEDEPIDSDDTMDYRLHPQPAPVQHSRFTSSKKIINPTGRMKRELKRRPLTNDWIQKTDPSEPVLLFTRPLDPEKLSAVGIVRPPDPPDENGAVGPSYRFHGRIGRGGRIIFDRWNPLVRVPLGSKNTYISPYAKLPQPNGFNAQIQCFGNNDK